ncbi:hypothetical protein [Streptomyces parvulus]|uniref:hypothetical protein n=1 Tax=Streptomyces parvulus TaxID=146923 RepID=UPI0037F6F80B
MTPSASERWIQRIMAGQGARPVGHPEPADGPQIPVQSPQPPAPPVQRRSPRLPDWWAPKPASLADQDDEPGDVDDDQDDEQPEPVEQVVQPAPAPSGPIEKVTVGVPKRTGVRKAAESAAGNRRLRIVAFNGTAAAFGYSLGLVDLIRSYLPAAEQAAVGTIGLVLAAGGAWGAWKVCGSSAVRGVFRDKTVFVRVLATVGAAEIGRRLAPVPVAYLNEYGQEWGLGPSAASLLITAGGICGGLWWVIDRRIRHWHWAYRWLPRVPLASALLACLPYETPPL